MGAECVQRLDAEWEPQIVQRGCRVGAECVQRLGAEVSQPHVRGWRAVAGPWLASEPAVTSVWQGCGRPTSGSGSEERILPAGTAGCPAWGSWRGDFILKAPGEKLSLPLYQLLQWRQGRQRHLL